MAHILIAYATRHGQTNKIAHHMASTLESNGHTVQLLDTSHSRTPPSTRRFDAAVLGGPIYAGGYPRSLVRFARQQRTWLETVPSAFFSVGLAVASRTTDGRAETKPLVEQFMRRTGYRPRRVELLAGALPYREYNPLIRFIMRRIAKAAGGDTDTTRNYEYTDWEAVDRFARDVAGDAELYRASSLAANEARALHRKPPASEPVPQAARPKARRSNELVGGNASRT